MGVAIGIQTQKRYISLLSCDTLVLARVAGLDTPLIVRLAPYIAHSVIAVAADYYMYKVTKKI